MLWFLAFLFTVLGLAIPVWLIATNGVPANISVGAQYIRQNIHWAHVLVATVFIVLLPWGAVAASTAAGTNSVVNGYQQFLNGSLVTADSEVVKCHEDGECVHEYDCDPYPVTTTYTTTDSDGNVEVHTETHTEYHSCPYATREYSYWVDSSLGDRYYIAWHVFALNPVQWRHGSGIPSGVFRGIPQEWKIYRSHIAAGNNDPVTKTGTYKNFILASQHTLLKRYSADIDYWLGKGLLPEHTAGTLKKQQIYDRWLADKINFVGFAPTHPRNWQARLMHFNAALGSELRGDLHIVAVNANQVSAARSENYANALIAYWQGPKFGKRALAKNGVMLVLGVYPRQGKIAWSRAKTGVPLGNGTMLAALESGLSGRPFNPQFLLGRIRAMTVADQSGQLSVKFVHSHGLIERIMFHDYPFQRICMECKDKDEKGQPSFVYLQADIELPWWSYLLDSVIGLFGAAIFGSLGLILATPNFWAMPDPTTDSYNAYNRRYRIRRRRYPY